LTCFPSTLTASVAGVPADQALKTTPLVASVASPVDATIHLTTEPATVHLNSVSLQVVPDVPGPGIGATTPPSHHPKPPAAVKAMTLPTPNAGSVHTLKIDGTGNDPSIRPAPGLYDVVVVQDITVNPSCVSDSTTGPGMGFEVQTTIGRVRFP
jgi:hypothetical protein